MSEREPSATVAPQAAEASAASLGAEPPSRSENAGEYVAAFALVLTREDCAFLAHVLDQWLGEGFSSVEDKLAHAERLREQLGRMVAPPPPLAPA